MLIPSLAERLEHLRGDARMRLHAGADDRDLAHLGLVVDAADAELGDERLERLARDAQVLARDRERHLGAVAPSPSGSFWMIMSTLTFASASAVKMRAGAPGSSGTPSSVTRASSVECVTAVMSGVLHGLLLSDDKCTGLVLEAGTAVDADAVVARVLDRAQLQHRRARAAISSISSNETTASLRASGTMRGSAL